MSDSMDPVSPASPYRNSSSRPSKRRKVDAPNGSTGKTSKTRRKSACRACRLRKIKCDATRPTCGECRMSDAVCIYTDPLPEKLTIDSATEVLSKKIDRLQDSIDRLQDHGTSDIFAVNGVADDRRQEELQFHAELSRQTSAIYTIEPSKDFLAIPAARTCADAILNWPIHEGRHGPNILLSVLMAPDEACADLSQTASSDQLIPGGLIPLDEESLASLTDVFLENVHTKNPVLDVEELVKHSRMVANSGIGWGAWDCLVLLAAALGSIAKPFNAAVSVSSSDGGNIETVWTTDVPTTTREMKQAESLFILACRRLGCLKPSILGSQCHFFAGVFLMYTLRPLLSWQYFTQASLQYQLYLKKSHRVTDDMSLLGQIPVQHPPTDSKHRRLEESMYWSCFKSESEFRVELPLPQSELSTYHHPQMFPSPPSPIALDQEPSDTGERLHRSDSASEHPGKNVSIAPMASEANNLRQHARLLCNEMESWYYYLTEIALRRIGNRIINTFFGLETTSWLNIKPWLPIALEFDTQVSAWSAHLPAAMQHWEMNDAIRAPASLSDGTQNHHVSRELSWATDNRLLEMRSWLYQPFLYYFIHQVLPAQYRVQGHDAASASPTASRAPYLEDFQASARLWPDSFGEEDAAALFHFISAGIECNMKILDVRSLRHRHHGLWYDMRSVMASSLILLGLVRAGHEIWLPGGSAEILWGRGSPVIAGKIGHILGEFDYWKDESPDLKCHRNVLEEITTSVRDNWRLSKVNGRR